MNFGNKALDGSVHTKAYAKDEDCASNEDVEQKHTSPPAKPPANRGKAVLDGGKERKPRHASHTVDLVTKLVYSGS